MRYKLLTQEQPSDPRQIFYCLIQNHSTPNTKKYRALSNLV